jgi:ribosomal protein L7Ae-like RNA K-turn-binding protein
LIQKLKKLYYNRKINPQKKKSNAIVAKKRYIVGMKEVLKHLRAENIKMIILATNIEEVDAQDGLDDYIHTIIQTCREFKIPLIFSLTRYKLGFVAKF